MDAYEIQEKIRNNETLIIDLQNNVRKYYSQIEELEKLKLKFDGLQGKLIEDNYLRRRKLEMQSSLAICNSLANRYISGMSCFLNGKEYHRVNSRLDEAKNKIKNQIRELHNQAESLQNSIAEMQRQNSVLYDHLKIEDNKGIE